MAHRLLSFPPWAGTTFVPRGPKTNGEIPSNIDPTKASLPTPFTAVITGASRGIGAATAKVFAQAGATGLILTARKAADIEETKAACEQVAKNKDLKVVRVSADVSEEISAINLAEIVKQEFEGNLDLLINNAGLVGTNPTMLSPLHEQDSSQVEVTTNTNYLGRVYMIKHLLHSILSNPRPTKSIINISSVGSHIPGSPLGFGISALATNRLSERVALMYGEQGVFCAAVHPGAVEPDVLPPGWPESVREWSTDARGLCGAWLVWLISGGERKEWLNGRYLDVTWDVEELEKRKEEIVEKDLLKMRMTV
ncbi:Hypothetical predicted protein [Lecanosticta acicola]|uniref:NAD(P)-binding protein n=1 Tax=Lecanosticta acicola TaxID=111012 RepID=A0AAI8YSE1_9PEZI|nr:Hypothetical predicted protein [Lecanosticta acicola]